MRTIDNIKTIVRAIPLEERLRACCDRIGRMAREAKGPRMSIPVEPGDDDIFITTTIKDAREELAKAHQSVVELNQRLIERQESFQAQLIRIEETWREKLREKDAQILGLREALGDACEALKGEGYYSAGSHYARALSSPPPPVVKLEDVRPLVEAITNAYITLAGDDHARLCGEQIIKIRDQFLTTYPQLS